MRPVIVLGIALLVLCAPLMAFDVSAYLYSGETAEDVSTQLLTISGAQYTLYSIKGMPALLVVDDKLMTEQAGIQTVLAENYRQTVLPSTSEISSIKGNLLTFNQSRNYQTRFGPVEKTCLQYIGYTTNPCNSIDTCYVTANIVCTLFASGGGGGGCYPEILGPMILEYGNAAKALDKNVADAILQMNSISSTNSLANIATLKADIANLKTAANAESNSKLRFPEMGDKCGDCVAVCPASHLDLASLDSASKSLEAISSRISKATTPEIASAQIAKSTQDRIEYQKSSALAAVWEPKWKDFKAKYSTLKANATSLSSINKDANYTKAIQTFSEKWDAMETRITSRNFMQIENDLAALQAAVPVLSDTMKTGRKPYDAAVAAQGRVSDALTIARWQVNVQDKESVQKYNELAMQKNKLDSYFKPPMTSEQYSVLAANYSTLEQTAKDYIQAQAGLGESVLGVGETFGQTAINGVFSLTDALVVIPSSARTSVAPVIPPVVLFLVDLAIVSVVLVVFIGAIIYFKPVFRHKAALGLWTAALFAFLFLLGIGSVGMFLMINQAANSGTFTDYLQLLSNSQANYIALDTEGASPEVISAMSTCAANMSGQLNSRFGKNSTIFTYAKTACAMGSNTSMTLSQCLDAAGNQPVTYMHFAKGASSPKFATVYQKRADIYGDVSVYTRCEIGDVIN